MKERASDGVAASLELAGAVYHVADAGDEGKKAGEGHGDVEEIEVEVLPEEAEGSVEEVELKHDAGDGDHLERGGGFAHPARLHVDFADEEMQDAGADEDDDVGRDD